MQLFFLNTADPNKFQGGALINDYSSLVWTERYRDYGEFQLVLPQLAESTSKLWPGALLGIAESTQVMLVETQDESVNDEGYRVFTFTGRTAESIIEDRVLWAPQAEQLTLSRQYTYLDAALLYIWQAVMNNTTSDVGYTVARPAAISTYNRINDCVVSDNGVTPITAIQKIRVSLGQIGPTVRTFLNIEGCGLRCIRPPSSSGTAKLVSVDPVNGTNKGVITKTPLTTTYDIRFDVYKGTDRSTDPLKTLYLSESAGHLDNVDVATTYKEFVTSIVHGVDKTHYYGSSKNPSNPVSQFWARHRYIDASSMTSNTPEADWDDITNKAATQYFTAHANRAFLSADMTEGSPFVFNKDYFLGDLVLLKYKDKSRRCLVSEYTRIDDKEGNRAYPTFIGIEEISGEIRDW